MESKNKRNGVPVKKKTPLFGGVLFLVNLKNFYIFVL
jgi:hypothetical protein